MSGKSLFEVNVLALMDRLAVAGEAQQAAQESSAGDGAFDVTYVFRAIDLDSGDVTQDIQTPAGFRGTIKALSIYDVTEDLTDTTTEARVEVGIQGGDVDAYAISDDLGALLIGAALTPALTAGVVGTIPAADDVLVTFVAPTGGTPEGIADYALTISYFV